MLTQKTPSLLSECSQVLGRQVDNWYSLQRYFKVHSTDISAHFWLARGRDIVTRGEGSCWLLTVCLMHERTQQLTVLSSFVQIKRILIRSHEHGYRSTNVEPAFQYNTIRYGWSAFDFKEHNCRKNIVDETHAFFLSSYFVTTLFLLTAGVGSSYPLQQREETLRERSFWSILVVRDWKGEGGRGGSQIRTTSNLFRLRRYVSTSNPKCRLYWCLIEFIDWRYSQSCWYFRPLL